MNRIFHVTFHGLGTPLPGVDSKEARYWIAPTHFQKLLNLLQEFPQVQINFDDGNLSDLTIGLPALLRCRMRATFYILAGRLDQRHYLKSADLRELLQAGMQIGSHGFDHRAWRSLSGDAARHEFQDATRKLEDVLGNSIQTAACPFGIYDQESLKLLRAAGFRRVMTSDGGWSVREQFLQSRNSLRTDESLVALRRAIENPGWLGKVWWPLHRKVKQLVWSI